MLARDHSETCLPVETTVPWGNRSGGHRRQVRSHLTVCNLTAGWCPSLGSRVCRSGSACGPVVTRGLLQYVLFGKVVFEERKQSSEAPERRGKAEDLLDTRSHDMPRRFSTTQAGSQREICLWLESASWRENHTLLERWQDTGLRMVPEPEGTWIVDFSELRPRAEGTEVIL